MQTRAIRAKPAMTDWSNATMVGLTSRALEDRGAQRQRRAAIHDLIDHV